MLEKLIRALDEIGIEYIVVKEDASVAQLKEAYEAGTLPTKLKSFTTILVVGEEGDAALDKTLVAKTGCDVLVVGNTFPPPLSDKFIKELEEYLEPSEETQKDDRQPWESKYGPANKSKKF